MYVVIFLGVSLVYFVGEKCMFFGGMVIGVNGKLLFGVVINYEMLGESIFLDFLGLFRVKCLLFGVNN